MKYKSREAAHRAMIRRAAEEFERTARLPHLTLVETPANGSFRIQQGEPSCESGMSKKVGEITVT